MAEGKGAGVAFEEAIADIFCFMGFEAKKIGGPGDTDVIVRWQDDNGNSMIGIIDGKSKSGGTVSQSDISDVAIDTHKEKIMQILLQSLGLDLAGTRFEIILEKKDLLL